MHFNSSPLIPSLLLLLMPVLGEVPSESANFFRLNERPHLSKQLSDFMLDMLLLPYGSVNFFMYCTKYSSNITLTVFVCVVMQSIEAGDFFDISIVNLYLLVNYISRKSVRAAFSASQTVTGISTIKV